MTDPTAITPDTPAEGTRRASQPSCELVLERGHPKEAAASWSCRATSCRHWGKQEDPHRRPVACDRTHPAAQAAA